MSPATLASIALILAALPGAASAGVTGSLWQGTWQRVSEAPGVTALLTITDALPNLSFDLYATSGANIGSLEGLAVGNEDHATFAGNDDCKLDFTLSGKRLDIVQSNGSDCGAGVGVDYRGRYVTAAAARSLPAQTLSTLGIVDAVAADRAARTLLGARHYQALLDSCNVIVRSDHPQPPDARVVDCFVRGLASSNAAIVISRRAELWIGLLVITDDDMLRMRYYTNADSAKDALPVAIRHWLDAKQVANAAPGSTTPLAIPVDREP